MSPFVFAVCTVLLKAVFELDFRYDSADLQFEKGIFDFRCFSWMDVRKRARCSTMDIARMTQPMMGHHCARDVLDSNDTKMMEIRSEMVRVGGCEPKSISGWVRRTRWRTSWRHFQSRSESTRLTNSLEFELAGIQNLSDFCTYKKSLFNECFSIYERKHHSCHNEL